MCSSTSIKFVFPKIASNNDDEVVIANANFIVIRVGLRK